MKKKIPDFEYVMAPGKRYTFQNPEVKNWVEKWCRGKVLNLFAGKTLLSVDEIRNDKNEKMPADYHLEALEFIEMWKKEQGPLFDTIILDPPYNLRKAMELYEGRYFSKFRRIQEAIIDILASGGRVITFGYSSTGMGYKRGYVKEALLVINHGGAFHDTYATVDEMDEFKEERDQMAVVERLQSKKLMDYMT